MESFDWLGPMPTEHKFYGGEASLFFDKVEHRYFRFVNDTEITVPGVTSAVNVVDKSAALMQWSANMATDYIATKVNTLGADCRCGNISPEMIRGWLDPARFAHKDYKENAATIGKIAHDWLERYIKNEMSGERYMMDLPTDRQAGNGCIAALEWMRKHKVRWVATERLIYSRAYEYAGTCDGLAYISSCGDIDCCGTWQKVNGKWEQVLLTFDNVLAVIDWKTSNALHDSYDWQTASYTMAFSEMIGVNSAHPELTEALQWRVVVRTGKDDAEFEARILTPETLGPDFEMFLDCLATYRRLQAKAEADKQRKKEIREQKRDDRLYLKCAKADKYKGFRYPKCNGGDPCQECLRKYNERQLAKGKDVIPTQENDIEVGEPAG
jgi:PD-(D/E)XK nuclease superfamily